MPKFCSVSLGSGCVGMPVTSAIWPAGPCRVYPAEGCFHIGRVAVLPQYRGTGLGRELMRRAEAYIRCTGGTAAELSGQVQASGFYKKLGYTPVGEVYPDEGCPHIRMQKQL